MLDEAREMEGDLRIGRRPVGVRGRDGPCLAELVDLDHPGRDRAAQRLPDQSRSEAAREKQGAEKGEPPILRLDARRADAIVPDLRRALMRDRKSTRLNSSP